MSDTPLTKQLRMLRKRHHYTQKKVSDYIGTTRANYSHYETGITIPSNDILNKLSILYNVPLMNLIKLSALSKKEELEKIKPEGKAGFDGLFIDNPSSPSLDPLYLEFINNWSEMSDKELKEWMEPEDLELIYYYHQLSPENKNLATEMVRLFIKNDRNIKN
ncbi:MAG: helix-turn-helix transcriptional regulator [Butyrivibrio sp.]|uniref:helix-turn-helix domain-containing protein n=1 Tax=Butyrivibrio sp. TaxID=28121 RepID=UPI001B227389|nr:helix-turn-helix transcriptional regulator [Butyrivibrio sp.]MBO6240683.1 helix-turn-helix transcriptional regulator [Butyrivibrio sp.]